jgi:hypothetical protein
MESTEHAGGRMASIVDENRLRRLLRPMLDPEEFLSNHGLRALSRWHAANPLEVAREDGTRPVFGGYELQQRDPAWHDLIPFHEYFHGDTGAAIGASHQTGWTGLVADLIIRRGR